ncbi:MAG: NTP transferase domain-containing protein [Candidatus Nanoarchaeia archaeon]
MKAVILAAGMGTRLGKYTQDLPKCMLSFNGKTLIEKQVETLRNAGITDITIVKGYHPEKINIEGTKTYLNKIYDETNMVETLFCAEQEMDDDILICYADILYEPKLLKQVLKSKANIGVAVDDDYWEYWSARSDKPEDDMESLVIQDGKITELGNTQCTRSEAKVRYIGLIKISKEGLKKFKQIYHDQKEKWYGKDAPWLRSKSFKNGYMTCMLQALINNEIEVNPIVVQRGWLEFDTVEDLESYTKWLNEGTLSRFYKV